MKRIFSILFFIWIAVLTQTVSAEEPAVVRVGYYENEIFQEGAEDGVIKRGYAYEYYRKLSEYTGWKYEYVYGSYNELYQKLLDGEIDFLAGLAKTDDRKGLIGYPAAAMGSETYNLIKHAADESITNDFATLANKRIGVLDGAMVGALNKFLNDYGVNATVVTYGDYQDLLDAFDNSVINVIAVEGSGTYGRAHAELLYTFGSTDYYLCVDIRNKELLKELNNTQRKLAAEEPFYLYMLRMKYYPAAISSKAFSADEQEWLKHHDTLKIGYLKNYLPYSDMDETGNVTGLLKDLLPSMLEAMDIQNL
ncbi:MAG: transporter substrate-binding domain-containing protein, partial [Schwartzia sp.]|nr:transporter substrate-binding domain-containing protein [Schwartzia sp. (in: firmicutes)]